MQQFTTPHPIRLEITVAAGTIEVATVDGEQSAVTLDGSQKAVDAMLDSLKLFGMGFSWGGFESLAIPFDCNGYRTATKWAPGGPTLRLHIGLENTDDLKADLDRGFAAFNAA